MTDQELKYKILKLLEEKPDQTQRELSELSQIASRMRRARSRTSIS